MSNYIKYDAAYFELLRMRIGVRSILDDISGAVSSGTTIEINRAVDMRPQLVDRLNAQNRTQETYLSELDALTKVPSEKASSKFHPKFRNSSTVFTQAKKELIIARLKVENSLASIDQFLNATSQPNTLEKILAVRNQLLLPALDAQDAAQINFNTELDKLEGDGGVMSREMYLTLSSEAKVAFTKKGGRLFE